MANATRLPEHSVKANTSSLVTVFATDEAFMYDVILRRESLNKQLKDAYGKDRVVLRSSYTMLATYIHPLNKKTVPQFLGTAEARRRAERNPSANMGVYLVSTVVFEHLYAASLGIESKEVLTRG